VPDLFALVETGPTFVSAPYGLFSAAPPVDVVERWEMGAQREGLPCGPAFSGLLDPCSTGPVTGEASHEGVTTWAAHAFWVYAELSCSPVGWGNDLARLENRATAALTNGEARAVERVFWTGETSQVPAGTVYPHLAADTQVLADPQGSHELILQEAADEISGVLDPVEALGLLEIRLADTYGGEGVIHVPRDSVPHLAANSLVTARGQQLRTLNGNVVAAYSTLGAGVGPDGATLANRQALWWYATPPVSVYRGPIQDFGIQPGSYMDRAQNTAVYQVGRPYLVWFDQCSLTAVEVSHGGVTTGAGGSAS